MNKIIKNLKFKIKNDGKQHRFDWLPSLPSMIIVSFLGIVSSNFDYYIALPNKGYITASPVPKTGNITVYQFPAFNQCVQSVQRVQHVPQSKDCLSLSLPDYVKIYIQPVAEKPGWVKIIGCSYQKLCENATQKYVLPNFLLCDEYLPKCLSRQKFDTNYGYKKWISTYIERSKNVIQPFHGLDSDSMSKLSPLLEGTTLQDLTMIAQLLPTNSSIPDINYADNPAERINAFKSVLEYKELLKKLTPEDFNELREIVNNERQVSKFYVNKSSYNIKSERVRQFLNSIRPEKISQIRNGLFRIAQIIELQIGW